MLDKFSLQNRPELRKVFHIRYISFSVKIKGEKLGGISEKVSMKIGYKFQTLIHYKYGVILFGS
jgi:hypothetical protein